MNAFVRPCRDFFVSLKLTVVLLGLAMILIFAATLAQVNLGIWAVQHEFFQSFVAIWHVGALFVPLPGGYLLGGLLLINLLAAHAYRFKFTWRKSGILLTHLGLILLLVGQLLTGLWQHEYQMRLEEGETKNYSESYQDNELAIINTTDPKFDDVVAIPESLLAKGADIQHPKLPFRVVTKAYFPNSAPLEVRADGGSPSLATTGVGVRLATSPAPVTYKPDERNIPAAYIELVAPEGSLGTWLVSEDPRLTPQHFTDSAGHSWKISLRATRAYKPFSLTLLKFNHDIYAGTDIPKNFSSRIRLTTPDGHEDREVLIYMNNPLRYAGLTFYQASFEKDNDHVTILQVVRNPSWLLPYLACGLMGLGLVIQFGMHLFGFIGRRRAAGPAAT